MDIAKEGIGNALTSKDKNHVVAVANDIYDETLQKYQSEINAEVGQGDGVYDISVANPTNGNPTPYGDLQAALTAFTDTTKKKGGMTVKFIQGNSADAKYVQYRLLRTTFPSEFSEDDWEIAGGVSEVVNDLVSSDTDKPLSANMGRILAYNLQLLRESLANLAFSSIPSLIDMGVDTSAFKYAVAIDLEHCTLSNSNPVTRNSPFESDVIVDSGYEISSVTITMGGVDVSATAYNDTNKTISIEEVTGDISIEVKCVRDSNIGYNVTYRSKNIGSSAFALYFGLHDGNFAISPMVDIANLNNKVAFSAGSSRDVTMGVILYTDKKGKVGTYRTLTLSPRTLTDVASYSYMRLYFKKSLLTTNPGSVFIKNTDTDEKLFDASELTLDENNDVVGFGTWEEYSELQECPVLADENGNYPECNTIDDYNISTRSGNGFSFYNKYPSVFKILYRSSGYTAISTMLSREIDINKYFTDDSYSGYITINQDTQIPQISLHFSIGGTTNYVGLGLIAITEDGRVGKWQGSPYDKSVLVSAGSYNKVQLHFRTEDLATAFVEIAATNGLPAIPLWTGADYVEQENVEQGNNE